MLKLINKYRLEVCLDTLPILESEDERLQALLSPVKSQREITWKKMNGEHITWLLKATLLPMKFKFQIRIWVVALWTDPDMEFKRIDLYPVF